MFRVLCAILLALDLGVDGYGYTSYSYSSGSGCSNGKCSSSSRSMSSPSMRSAVNNCGGNCCGGTAMGRSGSCMPSKMATSSYSISSATKPRFVAQMRPARQMISRSFSNKPLSNNFVSWSSWGPKSPVKTASSSSLSSLGQAWGPNCVLCKQPAQNPIRTVIPAVVKPQRRRSGCPLAHTRVGSSCRRSSLLTGPTSGTNETGNCYRVGGKCVPTTYGRNTPPPTYPPPTTASIHYPIEVLDYDSSIDQPDDEVYVDCIDCGDESDEYAPDYQQSDASRSDSSDYSSSSDEQYHEEPQGRQALRRRRITSWNSWGSSGQEVEEEERQEEYYQPYGREQRRRTRRKRNRPRKLRNPYRRCRYPNC